MIHGPYGPLNPMSSCLQKRKYLKKYPRQQIRSKLVRTIYHENLIFLKPSADRFQQKTFFFFELCEFLTKKILFCLKELWFRHNLITFLFMNWSPTFSCWAMLDILLVFNKNGFLAKNQTFRNHYTANYF